MANSDRIEFTAEEKKLLAEAITQAASGIAKCWEVLGRIGERIGKDWDPKETSVSDIADLNASDLENPYASEPLDAEETAEYFADPLDWDIE